jgi:hypothetical protein
MVRRSLPPLPLFLYIDVPLLALASLVLRWCFAGASTAIIITYNLVEQTPKFEITTYCFFPATLLFFAAPWLPWLFRLVLHRNPNPDAGKSPPDRRIPNPDHNSEQPVPPPNYTLHRANHAVSWPTAG